MKTILIIIQPFSKLDGYRTAFYLADGPSTDSYGVGEMWWQPAIRQRPGGSFDLFSPDLDGTIQAGKFDFSIAMNKLADAQNPRNFYWSGAPVTILSTDQYDPQNATVEFRGYVTSVSFDDDTNEMSVTAQVSTALITVPLLNPTTVFDGSGGAGGDASFRGTLYPAGFGVCTNIQPIWFDPINNIGVIDGYRNTISIDALYEGLSSFGARVADYPNYSTLVARIQDKTVKPGQWATCVAEGLVGLGAPQTGVITVSATFGGNRPGSLMLAWLLRAGVDPSMIDTVGLTAIDSLCPYPVHYWTAQQVQVSDLLTQMCASINASPLMTFQGRFTVVRAVIQAPVLTLDRAAQTKPRVLKWQSLESDPPFYLIKSRSARPVTVLTTDQVNYVNDVTDRGTWSASTIYAQGDLAWKFDGSSYLYINATASAGNALPPSYPQGSSNSYWQNLVGATAYADGTPLENLKPAHIGADVTSQNTAAFITNQGPGATASATQVINDYVPQADASNRVKFSMFEKGFTGWSVRYNPNNLPINNQGIGGVSYNGYPYYQVQFGGSGGRTASIGTDYGTRYPVNGAERICVQAAIQVQDGAISGQFAVWFYDVNGNALGDRIIWTGAAVGAFGLVYGFVNGYAGAVYCQVELYGFSASGSTAGLTLGIQKVMVSAASPSQTTPPQFVPGPNSVDGADVTIANTAANIVGQGSLAQQNYADWASQVNGGGKPANYADVTGQNTSAYVANQGQLATLNNDQRSETSGTYFGTWSGTSPDGANTYNRTTYVDGLGADQNIGTTGQLFITFSGGATTPSTHSDQAYPSIDIFDTNNNLLASLRLPNAVVGQTAYTLQNYSIRKPIPAGWPTTIRWRVACRYIYDQQGSVNYSGNSSVTNVTVDVYWSGLS